MFYNHLLLAMEKLTRSRIRSLSVQGCRVMGAIEKFCNSTSFRSGRMSNHCQLTHKFIVGHLVRIKLDPQRLSMARNARADRPIIWIRPIHFPPGVTNRSAQNAFVVCGRVMLQKDVLHAPETPGGERGNLGVRKLCGCRRRGMVT